MWLASSPIARSARRTSKPHTAQRYPYARRIRSRNSGSRTLGRCPGTRSSTPTVVRISSWRDDGKWWPSRSETTSTRSPGSEDNPSATSAGNPPLALRLSSLFGGSALLLRRRSGASLVTSRSRSVCSRRKGDAGWWDRRGGPNAPSSLHHRGYCPACGPQLSRQRPATVADRIFRSRRPGIRMAPEGPTPSGDAGPYDRGSPAAAFRIATGAPRRRSPCD